MRNMGKCSLGFYAKGILMELQHYRLLFLIPFPTLGFLELGKSTSKHPPPTLLNSMFGEKTKQKGRFGKKTKPNGPFVPRALGITVCLCKGGKEEGWDKERQDARESSCLLPCLPAAVLGSQGQPQMEGCAKPRRIASPCG